jgi:hypothetical protein
VFVSPQRRSLRPQVLESAKPNELSFSIHFLNAQYAKGDHPDADYKCLKTAPPKPANATIVPNITNKTPAMAGFLCAWAPHPAHTKNPGLT